MKYAIYRILYGEPFLELSVKSIIDKFDKIIFFWTDKPWGNITEVKYKGDIHKIPERIDGVRKKMFELKCMYPDKIETIYSHVVNNENQITYLINDMLLNMFKKPDLVMFIEPDHVFAELELDNTLNKISSLTERSNYNIRHFGTRQIEFWKDTSYYIQERLTRLSCMFWSLKGYDTIPTTGRHGENHSYLHKLDTFVYNFGYCVPDELMFWKFLLSLGYSRKIGDSIPNENWFEEKWVTWDYTNNNFNLEPSLGFEKMIPRIYKFPTKEYVDENLDKIRSKH